MPTQSIVSFEFDKIRYTDKNNQTKILNVKDIDCSLLDQPHLKGVNFFKQSNSYLIIRIPYSDNNSVKVRLVMIVSPTLMVIENGTAQADCVIESDNKYDFLWYDFLNRAVRYI